MGSLQMFVLSVFLVVSALIIVVFLFVFKNSKEKGEIADPNRKRALFFLTLVVTALTVIGTTFPKSPYFLFKGEKPQAVVFVIAKKFAFGLSPAPIKNDEDFATALAAPVRVPLNEVVEFRVTSWDVNHGFAVYDRGRLLAQVQAMPGYVNRLRWKFDKPGEYQVLCAEYCGAAHAYMSAKFVVGEETR